MVAEVEESGENRLTSTGQHQAIKVVGRSRQRMNWVSVSLIIVAALVSFAVVNQLRGPDRFREQLGTESEGDLARILASLSSESTALQEELGSLKVDLTNVRNSSEAQGAAADASSDQLKALQVLSGTVPVSGPGIELSIEDPNAQVNYDVLVDSVQELRDAGAEALSINGRRIGATSYFGGADGRVTLDDVVLPVPYSLSAIGPAATLEGGLKIPGGALDTLRALKGVNADVHRSNSLDIPALETR